MNIFNFTGNLGNDSDTRHTTSGKVVCSFSVAVKSGYGERESTNWVRCFLWGKRAEGKLPGYLIKGQQVAISGELSNREYENDGVKRYSLEVNVNTLDLIGKAGEQKPQPKAQNTRDDFVDDNIPF
jgi:single-strand DNA-binding protein|tara:strand:+ start:776 stop:1153 length:378 start_codon:yes stop_codon:yes gene_type:complete